MRRLFALALCLPFFVTAGSGPVEFGRLELERALSLARRHQDLSEREALRLLEELKDCRDGSACPHGRRTMLALSRDELARRFQRPGAVPL